MPYIPLFLHAEVVKFGKDLGSLGFRAKNDDIVIDSGDKVVVFDATGQKILKARFDENRQLAKK